MVFRALCCSAAFVALFGSEVAFERRVEHPNEYDVWLKRSAIASAISGYSLEEFESKLLHQRPISAFYRSDATHEFVPEFLFSVVERQARVSRNRAAELVSPILYYAEVEEIPLSLAISVAAVESGFRPSVQFVNSNSSVDRGLFQLNSKSFPHLSNKDFFVPDINAMHAMRHLRYCLRVAKNDYLTAMAIYNAGWSRVRDDRIPESTKVYVQRISDYRQRLIADFRDYAERKMASVAALGRFDGDGSDEDSERG